MENKNRGPLQKARNYAFLLLKFRLRSEKEILQRLKKKKFDEGIIQETLSFLKEKGFVDDCYFTKVWIESRIKRPLGLRRIRAELQLKGIAGEIIDSQLEEVKKEYSEEDLVFELAKVRIHKLKSIDPQKAKRRTLEYLLRRGFSLDIVLDALNQLCKQIP